MAAYPKAHAQDNVVDAAYQVSERCTAMKVQGVLLDLTTARAIITVAEALSPANREKLAAMPIDRAARICWKLVT